MKKYFLHNGSVQEGPFSIDELRQKNINSFTNVWYEGIENWTKAENIDELKSILSKLPPPLKKTGMIQETIEKSKNVLSKDLINEIENKLPNENKKKFFKWSVVILTLIGIIAIISFAIQKSSIGRPNIDESTMIENQKGRVYYENYFKYWSIHIGGIVVNKTSDYRFRDFIIEVNYYNKHKILLATKSYTIFKTLEPLGEVDFSTDIKDNVPEGSSELDWKIKDATSEKIKTNN